MNRRTFITASSLTLVASSCASSKNESKSKTLYFVGGGSGKNGGLHLYKSADKGETIELLSIAGKEQNHGFQVFHNDTLYSCVSMGQKKDKCHSVKAYKFNHKTNNLDEVSSIETEGSLCHVAAHGSLLVVTAYGAGYIESFQLGPKGEIQKQLQKYRFTGGSNVDPKRQNAPHPHCFTFDHIGKFGFMPDLGRDLIQTFEIRNNQLIYRRDLDYKSTPGAGPRHLTFHPDGHRAYLINELDFTLVAFIYQDGKLTETDAKRCLPKDFTEWNSCADVHVHPDGHYVYASNRGHNSLAIFKILEEKIDLLAHEPTQGETPRNFGIYKDYALVANQNSDNIIFFDLDPDTGLLSFKSKTEGIGRPSCVNVID
ncbi:lactonase family protein [Lentisphaera profundi]|uniref:Lactonase family protein n=1 Tax=Lentisphaera profundi TaxID=1658616 RepID=A0ABY7VQJ6_9BACT|nr:lactonase family protein [Lentisphaera profundi]WDE95515.1 lactonase family protein [Lentisphaera profundi]